jgi:hypothetical protein
MFKNCTEEEMFLFAGISRKEWFRRNEFVHGGPFLNLNILAQQAKDAMLDFSAAKEKIRHSIL